MTVDSSSMSAHMWRTQIRGFYLHWSTETHPKKTYIFLKKKKRAQMTQGLLSALQSDVKGLAQL